jgi:predicted TIM-barrel fold metal-dependent hydrolase
MLGAKMIDAHIHVENPHLPGSKPFPDYLNEPAQVAERLRCELRSVGIEQALAIGSLDTTDDDPLGTAFTLEVAEQVPGLFAIGVADPRRTDTEHMERVERQLQSGRVKALKAYLGYLYYSPDHPGYRPYYRLAAEYGIPIVFHTGDNYSTKAKVKYAHPLLIDEVAVDYPETNFVIAHFGCPWFLDAAEVIYKNNNVWADLSGLLVGDEGYFREQQRRGQLGAVAERVAESMNYTERPDRFIYGSDWPLAPMRPYLFFANCVVSEDDQQAVFEENARELFGLQEITR